MNGGRKVGIVASSQKGHSHLLGEVPRVIVKIVSKLLCLKPEIASEL